MAFLSPYFTVLSISIFLNTISSMTGPSSTTKIIVPVISVFIIISARLLLEVFPRKPPMIDESPVPITFPIYRNIESK